MKLHIIDKCKDCIHSKQCMRHILECRNYRVYVFGELDTGIFVETIYGKTLLEGVLFKKVRERYYFRGSVRRGYRKNEEN